MKTFLQGLLFSALTIIAPIKGLIALVMLFVAFDTIIGIYASIKTGHEFRSSRLFGLVIKTFFYTGSIMLAYGIDMLLLNGMAFGIKLLGAKVASVIWCWIESTSINEKSMMLGNRSIWEIIKEIIKRAKALKEDIKDVYGK